MSEEIKKYRIDLDEDQLDIISKSLDMVARMQCGQLENRTLFPIWDKLFEDKDFTRRCTSEIEISDSLKIIKKNLFPDIGEAHYGIGYSEESDRIYDMYKEMRHCVYKTLESESYNVHSDPPRSHTNHRKIKVTYLTTDILRDEEIDKLVD